MTRSIALCIWGALLPCLTGCLIVPFTAHRSPYPANRQPNTMVVLLPITPARTSQEILEWGATRSQDGPPHARDVKSAVGSFNQALDAFAGSRASRLIGPKALKGPQGGNAPDWGTLLENLEGEQAGPVELPQMMALGEAASTSHVISWKLSEVQHGYPGVCGWPLPLVALCFWQGTVTVEADLWEAPTGHRVACSTRTMRYWGSMGNFPFIIVGHAILKTRARAVEQAIRWDLDDLFARTGLRPPGPTDAAVIPPPPAPEPTPAPVAGP